MSDYISIQKAIEKINERARETFTLCLGYKYYLGALHDVADDLRKMPTIDAVPVVRCKDCRHWYGETENDAIADCGGLMTATRTTPDFFCAYGERKYNE